MSYFCHMKKYILAFDQGTTSSRSILFDADTNIISIAKKEITPYYPQTGWVEHDANEIWDTQLLTATEVIHKSGLSSSEVAAIGITNQRETTIVWNRNTGQPIYHAIVWQDRRMVAYCDSLASQGLSTLIRNKTGLIIDAYFSATKILWILDNVPHAREQANKGELCFGTVDSWLIWKLTNGKEHITDITNASRTMLFNIHTLEWDEELLHIFNIPKNILPMVKSCSEIYGYTNKLVALNNIPIAGVAGDQQAALFGQQCVRAGMVKNTYGTGCFMLMNIGSKPILSNHSLLTTVAWKIGDDIQYALEGSVFIGGAVVQWLRDGLGFIHSSKEIETLANEVTSNEGVYLVPAFTGLGAPYWKQQAKGLILGLTRNTTKAHIARAALESICYQTSDLLNSMKKDTNIPITELRVDGGAVDNTLLMQFQSDILQTKIIRPIITETTALGAAYLAGLAVGVWTSKKHVEELWKQNACFTHRMPIAEQKKLLNGWEKAIQVTLFNADLFTTSL